MTRFFELPTGWLGEHHQFVTVIQSGLRVRNHADLFHWLQGDLQFYLPHEILLAAWCGANEDLVELDVISPLPGLRSTDVVGQKVAPFIRALFCRWKDNDHGLFQITSETGFTLDLNAPEQLATGFRRMRSALVHGVRDQRGQHHCLYVAFSSAPAPSPTAGTYFKLLLPHIDTALRQVTPLPPLCPVPAAQPYRDFGLTPREKEIMNWVRAGKTNEVVGVILNISPFTVKNHLKRIFRKLEVSNRAQAVSKF